ncbi:MAG TPA: tetratricopeptide repeat protein [Gemmatimonadales bacterium]|nr:tetratricopeptide repeat protein [Gemmatimonadales bacterium]
MRLRLALVAALGSILATQASAQIPSGARRLGTGNVAAPKLMVANPYSFLEGDSVAAVEIGTAMRLRMERVAGTTYRVIPVKQMQAALEQYGYPLDAILSPIVARRLAQELQARVLLASTMTKVEGGTGYAVTARLAGLNDDAGNVVVVKQAPGQSLKQLGEAVADQLTPAVKSADEAKQCVDLSASKPDAAAAAAKKATAILPNNGLAQYCLAQLAMARKAPSSEVIADLQAAVTGDPQSLRAWTELAKQYDAQGDSAKVVDAYQQMLLAAPTNQPLREEAFKIFIRYGRPDAAVQAAQEGLRLDPSNADLWDLLGNAYATLGDYPKAIQSLEHVYTEAPERADSTYFLKITVFAAAQPDTAALLKWARLGGDKFPDNPTLMGQLVTAYGMTGPVDSLVAVTSRLIAIDTAAVVPALTAAKSLADQKRIAEAMLFTDFAIAHGDAGQKESAAAILTNGALPLLQPAEQNLPLAADVLRKAVAAAAPDGRVAPSANYLFGLATFYQVPAIDKQAEATRSCELARKEEALLAEAKSGFTLGQATRPADAAKNLDFINQFQPRVASMIKAYCQ